VLEPIETLVDIQRHLEQQAEVPATISPTPEAVAPSWLYQATEVESAEANEPTTPPTNRSQPPADPAFTDLFRQSKTGPER